MNLSTDPITYSPAQGARWMAKRGLRITPLDGKIAFVKDWQTKATTDLGQISAIAQDRPGSNFGCVAKLGEFFMVDEDIPGFVDGFTKETGMALDGFKVRSSGEKLHYYFQSTAESDAIGKNITEKELGGAASVRLHNAYCVAPFSIHPATKAPYVPVDIKAEIKPAPVEFIKWILAQCMKTEPAHTAEAPTARVPRGQHDVTLTAIAGRLRADGLNAEEMEPVLIHRIEETFDDYGSDYREMARKVARSIGKKPAGDPGPTVFIGGKLPGSAQAQHAETKELVAEALADVEKRKQEFAELEARCDEEVAKEFNPYPTDAWEGTPYLDFARLCRSEDDPKFQNYLPTEFGINALMTVVGAICGHRICPDFDPTMDARFYTVLLTPRGGSGKGTIFKFSKDVFDGTHLLYKNNKLFQNIGAFTDDFASARGLTESFQFHPSILQVYEELSTPFEKFGIAGSGTSFKDLNLRLFDSTDPQNSRKEGTKVPKNAPTAIHNSILGSTTTEKGRWDEMFSSSNDDTLRQRLNIIPSEEDRRVIAIKQPDFTEVQLALLDRIGLLNSYKLVWSYSQEAWDLLNSWFQEVDKAAREAGDNDEREALGRIQVHIHRVIGHLALWLAPLPSDITHQDMLFDRFDDPTSWAMGLVDEPDEHEPHKPWIVEVPADWMRRAIRIAEHQIQTRHDHRPSEGLTPVALCENLIKKHMSRKNTTRWFSLVRVANLDKYGLDVRLKALFNAQRERAIRIDADPEDKDNQAEWIVTWLGRGWKASWKETRGGRRAGAGRKTKKGEIQSALER